MMVVVKVLAPNKAFKRPRLLCLLKVHGGSEKRFGRFDHIRDHLIVMAGHDNRLRHAGG
jgi:hypothetical protein